MKTDEIYPTNIVPIVTAEAPMLMKWGFPRFDGKGQVISARLETASENGMFRKEFVGQRCLVPASNYFEWEKAGTKKVKFAIGSHEPIYMAGLYRFDDAVQVPLFVILTRPAAPGIAFIHDRMPVILAKDMQQKWLSKNVGTPHIMEGSLENLIYRDVAN